MHDLRPMRCQAHRFIPYLLVLIALSPDALRGGAARTVQIEQGGPTSLLQALQDASVDHILLAGSYSVAPELPKSLPSPVRLSRCVACQVQGASVGTRLLHNWLFVPCTQHHSGRQWAP